jgi:hypothetical protein
MGCTLYSGLPPPPPPATRVVTHATPQTDEFQLSLRSLGPLTELVLGHDNSGLQPDWFCDLVSVTDTVSRVTYWFVCGKWLATNRDDGRIERVIKASLQAPHIRRKVAYKVRSSKHATEA